jgi:hypothetical protein
VGERHHRHHGRVRQADLRAASTGPAVNYPSLKRRTCTTGITGGDVSFASSPTRCAPGGAGAVGKASRRHNSHALARMLREPPPLSASLEREVPPSVRVINESAVPAREPGPGDPVRPVDVPALGAGAGGVRRIDVHHRYPRPAGLVSDESPQLGEGPGGVGGPLGLAKPYPFADPCQVFQGDSATGAPPLPKGRGRYPQPRPPHASRSCG